MDTTELEVKDRLEDDRELGEQEQFVEEELCPFCTICGILVVVVSGTDGVVGAGACVELSCLFFCALLLLLSL